jgi:hypothetical protein
MLMTCLIYVLLLQYFRNHIFWKCVTFVLCAKKFLIIFFKKKVVFLRGIRKLGFGAVKVSRCFESRPLISDLTI